MIQTQVPSGGTFFGATNAGQRFFFASPQLNKYRIPDNEIEEKFVRGSGPGGQKINKTNNNVQLKHLPTGIMVHCQEGRSLASNRGIARKLLEKKVEHFTLGTESRIGKAIAKKKRSKSRKYRKAREKHALRAEEDVTDDEPAGFGVLTPRPFASSAP